MSFEFELVCQTLCQMRDLQFFCLRVVAVEPEQNPQKPTRKKAYSANILFYGSIMRGLHLCSPRRPTKTVLRELQTRFAGRRDAGSARVALRTPIGQLLHDQ